MMLTWKHKYCCQRLIFLLIYLWIKLIEVEPFRLEMCPPPEGRLWVDFPKDLQLDWSTLAACNSSDDCINAELVLKDIRPQVMPIFAQLGQRVSMSMPLDSLVFQATEAEFLSCQPSTTNHPQRNLKSILLRPDRIQRAQSSYLLVRSFNVVGVSNSSVEDNPCYDGMRRVNISWVSNGCTDARGPHRFACSRNGEKFSGKCKLSPCGCGPCGFGPCGFEPSAAATQGLNHPAKNCEDLCLKLEGVHPATIIVNKSPFKCWCCEDYWSDNEHCPQGGPMSTHVTALNNDHDYNLPTNDVNAYCDCKLDPMARCCLHGACQSNPCRNGGVCRNRFADEGGGYECICALGFVGSNCERTDLATCDLAHCPPQHHCFQNSDGGTECVPDDIREQLPSCDSSLCFNQAECYIVRQTARCFCSYLFEGAYCRRGGHGPKLVYNASKSRVYFGLGTFACAFGTLIAVLVICRVHTWKCYVVPKNRRRSDYSAWGDEAYMGEVADNGQRTPSPIPCTDETSRISTLSSSTRQNLYTAESEELMLEHVKPVVHANGLLGGERDMLVTRT